MADSLELLGGELREHFSWKLHTSVKGTAKGYSKDWHSHPGLAEERIVLA